MKNNQNSQQWVSLYKSRHIDSIEYYLFFYNDDSENSILHGICEIALSNSKQLNINTFT